MTIGNRLGGYLTNKAK